MKEAEKKCENQQKTGLKKISVPRIKTDGNL